MPFIPIQHRYFISGSFDNRIRLWNILEHRVVEWAQTAHFVTACAFSPPGQMLVAGLHHGQCVFYQTQGLKYYTQLDCRNRQGKHKRGKKVTGLDFSGDGRLLLVTTNDSRVRAYRMQDFSLVCKMKGVENEQLQIPPPPSARTGSTSSWAATRSSWPCGACRTERGQEQEGRRAGRAAGCPPPAARAPQPPRPPTRRSPPSRPPPLRLCPACLRIPPPSAASSSSSSSSSASSLKTDAFEYFKALDDTVTCAIFLPRSAIAFSSAGESAATMPVRNIILTTGISGEIKIYRNRMQRPQQQQTAASARR